MMSALTKTALLLCLAITPRGSWGEESSAGPSAPYRFTIWASGYGGEFSVFDNEESPAAGILSEEIAFTPYLSLESPRKYVFESDVAYSTRYDVSSFRLDRQLVGQQEIDLDTSVEGYSVYVIPTLLVSPSGRETGRPDSDSLVIGAGLGLGYMSASGDVVFTETTGERKAIDISGPALAMSVFTDYRIGRFIYQFSIDITSVFADGSEYSYTGFSLKAGYVFEL